MTATYQTLTECLPDLDALTEKVARVHGPATPSLLEAREAYLGLALALQSLALQREEAASSLLAARNVTRLRSLTRGYSPPANACRSYRAMLAGLASLDQAATPLLQPLTGLADAGLPLEAAQDWRPQSSGCASGLH